MRCDTCGNSKAYHLWTVNGATFCDECGKGMEPGPIGDGRRPTRQEADAAFEKLGLTDKLMKEAKTSRKQILADLEKGIKPKDKVVKGGNVGPISVNV